VTLGEKNPMQDKLSLPELVYGVDFSGAKNAGSKIWITKAIVDGTELQVEDCCQAKELFGTRERDQCLHRLRDFIVMQKACAFGLDFPFGLPSVLIEENTWEEFVLSFSYRYSSPKEFKDSCWVAAGHCELKRHTDKVNQTTWSPCNLRLYRQTYFGIRDVLAPLVRDQLVYVLPMQSPSSGRPWIFEVCPASTLQRMGLRQPYKDKEKSTARARILQGFEHTGTILIQTSELRTMILGDQYGDALDSVIAAFATFQALRNPACHSVSSIDAYAVEGYVYV
jgi:hypothetical protein